MSIPYRWVIVFLGGLMGCVAIGAMFSLAVFLEPMSAETGWSRAGISTAMTIDFLIMGVAGFLWGTLSDRYGPRSVVLIGAVLLGTGLVVASRATSLLTFQLGFGLIVGLSAGAFFAPMIAAVTGWFDTRRGARRQPRLRRHGHGAAHFHPLRRLADRPLRLAHRDGHHRRHRLGPARSPRPFRPTCARRRRLGRWTPVRPMPARASLAAVHHPRRHLLPLLRRPLRPDLPHAELRRRRTRDGPRAAAPPPACASIRAGSGGATVELYHHLGHDPTERSAALCRSARPRRRPMIVDERDCGLNRRSRSACAGYADASAKDLVGLAQLTVLPFQRLQPVPHLGRHAVVCGLRLSATEPRSVGGLRWRDATWRIDPSWLRRRPSYIVAGSRGALPWPRFTGHPRDGRPSERPPTGPGRASLRSRATRRFHVA